MNSIDLTSRTIGQTMHDTYCQKICGPTMPIDFTSSTASTNSVIDACEKKENVIVSQEQDAYKIKKRNTNYRKYT